MRSWIKGDTACFWWMSNRLPHLPSTAPPGYTDFLCIGTVKACGDGYVTLQSEFGVQTKKPWSLTRVPEVLGDEDAD
jgi:hypothetical protein